MAEFLQWPDPRLSAVAEPVTGITDDIRAIWDEMILKMDAMPGVGLAAPQLGIGLRLAVVDASAARGQAVRMANPEIISTSPQMQENEEASPNLPGFSAKIKRPNLVSVRFLNKDGVIDRRDFEGLWAASMLHQIDHLNGKLFFDNLSRTKRAMFVKKLSKRGLRS